MTDLIDRLFQSDDLDLAWFLAKDGVPGREDARIARLVSWDGTAATVEHEGACDLVIARTFDAGWLATIDDKPEQPVLSADCGFQAVRSARLGHASRSFALSTSSGLRSTRRSRWLRRPCQSWASSRPSYGIRSVGGTMPHIEPRFKG